MKILIISSGRAGSSSLLHGLHASIKGAKKKFEPFNKDFCPEIDFQNHLKNLTNINSDQIYIEKDLIFDPVRYKHIWLSAFCDTYFFPCERNEEWFHKKVTIEIYKNYCQNFDKIILLGRKNLKETAISWAHYYKTNNYLDYYTPDNNIDYTFELKLTKIRNKQLLKLSKTLNKDIVWYEDLFSGSKHYLNYFLERNNIQIDNLELFYSYFDPKNRYRQIL